MKWFSLKYQKGSKKHYAAVYVVAPMIVLPTLASTRRAAINEAIDRIIEHLNSMRIR